MLYRLVVSLALGAIMGLEREAVGKEAGIRTAMLVSAGATIFTMIALVLPYIVTANPEEALGVMTGNGSVFSSIANIVVGIGFLGAGIIIQTGEHVRGLTTAAVVWTIAAIGTVVGLGLVEFAAISTILIAGLLYLMRTTKIHKLSER